MARSKEQLTPDRLCNAADAVLKAAVKFSQEHLGVRARLSDLLSNPALQAILQDFRPCELQEALEFLDRLGMVSITQKERR